MRNTRQLRTAPVGLLAVAVLAGCGTDTATPPTTTVTATMTKSAAPSPTAESPSEVNPLQPVTDPTGSAATTGQASCNDGDGPIAAAQRDMQRIPAPRTETGWENTGSGGMWCGGLSWATLRAAGGMGPVRPHQLLIYENGTFMGTGITCSAWYGQDVLSTTSNAIVVRYSYPDIGNEAQTRTQNPLGRADVTYRWNGSRIVMVGTVPPPVTQNGC